MVKKSRIVYLPTAGNFLLASCIIITGFTGLVAEICWIKKSTLIFGSTMYAISTVVAIFFSGLAIGNVLLGKKSGTVEQPVLWYGLCELAAGFLIALSPLLFGGIDKAYTGLYPVLAHSPFFLVWVKIILVSFVLLPPTLVMGGSLPLMNRHFIRTNTQVTPSISLLYAINTLGGAGGVFLCGLVFIPALGLTQTLIYAGMVNIGTAGIVLLWIYLYKPEAPAKAASKLESKTLAISAVGPLSRNASVVMGVLFFIAGCAAMGNELIWARYLGLVIHNTVYTYTITLGAILIGIACGSLLVRLFSATFSKAAITVYAVVNLLCGFSVTWLLWITPRFWNPVIDSESSYTLFLIALSVMLVPSIVSGISFPVGLRVIIQHYKKASVTVGYMTAINMIGSIIGSFFFGFIALPFIGLQRTILISSLLYTIVSCCAFFLAGSSKTALRTRVAATIAVIVWVVSVFPAPVKIPRDYLSIQGKLVNYTESINSVVSVVRNSYGMIILEIDRLWQGSDRKTHQVMAAHIPAMLHPDPRCVAVVGVGVGQTARRFLFYPIEKLDCIDIEQSIFPVIRQSFSGAWLDDKRVTAIVDDGRDYLKHTSNTYDIISIEIGQLFRPQCAPFYTVEFYRSIKKALNPNALVSQFVPLAFLDRTFFLRIIKTFIDVFPTGTLWYNGNELLLIGGLDARVILDPARVAALLAQKDISADCSFSIWGGVRRSYNRIENIAAAFLGGPGALEKMTKGYSALTNDRPELEYATAHHQKYQLDAMNETMDFLAAYSDPVVSIFKNPLPDTLIAMAKCTREYNLLNVKAVGFLQEYLQTGVEEHLKKAFSLNPFNLDIITQAALYASNHNDPDGARRLYYQSLKIDSTYSPAYNNLGAFAEQRGNLVEASRLYRKAVHADSLNAEAYLNISTMYVKRDIVDSAIFFLRRTVLLKPDNQAAKNTLKMLEDKLKKR